jgi:hypothetical protein
MYKLKTIGLSALAGTLMSLSAAQAGGVTVGGTMEVTYTALDQDEIEGTKIGTKKNISFSGGGEFANGWSYGIYHAQNDAMSGLSSSSMNINMGGIATLAYDSGTGSYGANAVDNIVPTAWEEIDYGLNTGITDIGQVSKQKGVINFTVRAPGSGTGISLSYAPRMGTGHISDGGTSGGSDAGAERGFDVVVDFVNTSNNWFGFRWGTAGELIKHPVNCKALNVNSVQSGCVGQAEDEWGATHYTSLRLGPFSTGFQASLIDSGDGANSAVARNASWVLGSALTFGNFLSLSYGVGEDQYKWNDADRMATEARGGRIHHKEGEQVTSVFKGGSVAMNWGPLALKYAHNWSNNQGGKGKEQGGGNHSDEHKEINLSMAF